MVFWGSVFWLRSLAGQALFKMCEEMKEEAPQHPFTVSHKET